MAQFLITGGAGFIGSHTCLVLLQDGHRLMVLDDFSNSSPIALERVVELAGRAAADRLSLLPGDIRDRSQPIMPLQTPNPPLMQSSISQV